MGHDVLVAGQVEVGFVEDANRQLGADGISFCVSDLDADFACVSQGIALLVRRGRDVQPLLRIDIDQPFRDQAPVTVRQGKFDDPLEREQFLGRRCRGCHGTWRGC